MSLAKRYFQEFRELLALEPKLSERPEAGKSAGALVQRLLCGSENGEVYSLAAFEELKNNLARGDNWPIMEILLGCLLQPERGYMSWVSSWTVRYESTAVVPGHPEWERALEIRGLVWNILLNSADPELRVALWKVLGKSHQRYNGLVVRETVKKQAACAYCYLLGWDLAICGRSLNTRRLSVSVREAEIVREFWSWELKFGTGGTLCEMASVCQELYESLPVNEWRLHDFFSYGTEEENEAEVQRVAKKLRDATDDVLYHEFFAAAEEYLKATPHGGHFGRINELARALADLYLPGESENAQTPFIHGVLHAPQDDWKHQFVCVVCQEHLLAIKRKGGGEATVRELERLIGLSSNGERMILNLYSNPHPIITGTLTEAEFDFILQRLHLFSALERLSLLGEFAPFFTARVLDYIDQNLLECLGDEDDAYELMNTFTSAAWLTALRYDLRDTWTLVDWIVNVISDQDLDGALLASHELDSLRKWSGYVLTMPRFLNLLRRRVELEMRPRSPGLSIMPIDFAVEKWCAFNQSDPVEVESFKDICRLALDSTFLAVYWIPKYIAALDKSGTQTAAFVTDHINAVGAMDCDNLMHLASLASSYSDSSEEWAKIAPPICRAADKMTRDDRERIYFGLSKKETPVLVSMPGEVPDHYIQALDEALRLYANEPRNSSLRGYREWAVRNAEYDLNRERGRAEEDANG